MRTTRTFSTLVGKVDIRKLAEYQQSDPDAYSYTGGLCLANQGLLEFVEMFKAPIKVLNPLLTATQEKNYKGTEPIGAIPLTASSWPTPMSRNGPSSSTIRKTRLSWTVSTKYRCRTASA